MKIVSFFFLCLISISLNSIPVEEGDFREFLYGQSDAFAYDNWLSHVAENVARPGYNLYAPFDIQTPGFGSYTAPDSTALRHWESALEEFLGGNFPSANAVLNAGGLPFQVLEILDTNVGRDYYVIREFPDTTFFDDNGTDAIDDDEHGAFTYGWGMVIYNPASQNPEIVSVIHPCDDYIAVAVGYEAFITLNARYLIINGAGREVAFSGSAAGYTNARSKSDPSRNSAHPYNTVYKMACDEIRETFQMSEFALQIHSYDNSSDLQTDVILSTGFGIALTLPVNDLSSRHHDIINNLPYEIPIEGDYEVSEPNTIINYLGAAGNTLQPAYYYLPDGSAIPISLHNEYYGVDNSYQFIYTKNYNDSYTFKNWLHVEMREEPSYSDNYLTYYNYNEETGSFDWQHRFDHAIAYNYHWIDSLTEILPDVISRDDGNVPPTSPIPLTFRTINNHQGVPYYAVLEWRKTDDYNFRRYDIEMANDSLFVEEYSIIETITNPSDTDYSLWGENLDVRKWFRICATDYDDNRSFSNLLYIDPDMQHHKIAVAPDISYRIIPQSLSFEDPFVNVRIENNGNETILITEILGIASPFLCPQLSDSQMLEVYPCSSSVLSICFRESRPGRYKNDFFLRVNAENTSQLKYTVQAEIPAPVEAINMKAIVTYLGDGLFLCWEGDGGSYEIYRSESPVTGFQLVGTTTQNNYRIDENQRVGFFKVMRVGTIEDN